MSIRICLALCLLLVLPTACGASAMQGPSDSICIREVVLRVGDMKDAPLARAILCARQTMEQFLTAFESRAPAQTHFMVVTLQPSADAYIPVGILVESHDHGTVSGWKVSNSLEFVPTKEKASCQVSAIIDWRYVDTLEMEGGVTYRELYGRQQKRVQFTIRDELPFLIARDEDEGIARESLNVFRDVANARCGKLSQVPDDVLATLTADMPVLGSGIGRRVRPVPVSVAEYAAMYGNREVINLLSERKLLEDKACARSLILDSCWAGNLDSTNRLIELGFDIECSNEMGDTPLMQAVTWNHVDVTKLLLKCGANSNARDNGGQTPLFRAKSVEVVAALIAAGASVNALDDQRDSCLAVQLFRGNRTVVRLLVESGAELKYGPRGVVAETRVNGKEAMLEWLQSTGNTPGLDEVKTALSVDYGYVLPVTCFGKGDFYRPE